MKQPRLFLSPPHMGGDELPFIQEAFATNYIAPLGPMVDAFEREFAEYTGIPHCLAVSSGTAAMHLALRHVLDGIRAKPRADTRPPLILASSFTFIASVTPAVFEGCELGFIDCDRESWNMDPALLEKEVESLVRTGRPPAAVIPTDLYGQCCNLPVIRAICDRHGIPVICDSAEAVGARYEGGRSQESEIRRQKTEDGTQEDARTAGLSRRQANRPSDVLWTHAGYDAYAAIFSFNGNKIITTSGGGMLASHDEKLIAHARKLATQARDPAPHYEHTEIGYNYRMSNIVAAIGRGQLRVLDKRVTRRREVFEAYRSLLCDLPGVSFMPEPPGRRATRWLTVVLFDPTQFGASTDQVREALEAENIEARPAWKPMHLQPVFQGCRAAGGAVSENIFRTGLCLPSGTAMANADVQRVAEIVRRQCRKQKVES